MSYNGWTNYETWCISLWIDNEETSYRFWQARAEDLYEEAESDDSTVITKLDNAKRALADELKESLEETMPPLRGHWADLMNAALSDVNWSEIATHLLERFEGEETKKEKR